jgi:hypothetical protein
MIFYTGNIRVFCRIRPFLLSKKEKQSIVEDIGENDLVVANPSKEGKDAHRSFKFNKIFGPTATQGLFLYTLFFEIRLWKSIPYIQKAKMKLCIIIPYFKL